MLRKIGKTLLCVGGLVSSCAFAATHALVQGMSISYDLPVNSPQVFANFLMWPISAVCTINEAEDNHDISVASLNRTGTINGNPLAQGQSLLLTVHPGDDIKIYAVAGAKVELTNKGSRIVKARCTTA